MAKAYEEALKEAREGLALLEELPACPAQQQEAVVQESSFKLRCAVSYLLQLATQVHVKELEPTDCPFCAHAPHSPGECGMGLEPCLCTAELMPRVLFLLITAHLEQNLADALQKASQAYADPLEHQDAAQAHQQALGMLGTWLSLWPTWMFYER